MTYIFCTLLLLAQLVLSTLCNNRKAKSPDSIAITNSDTLYYFDTNKRTIEQPFDAFSVQENYKFIQVEVTEVVNPKRHPVLFEVYYVIDQSRTLLGSFSLYPADNTGKFIVPTQGKLRKPGTIILSLVVPERMQSTDTFKIVTTKMRFVPK